MTLIVAEGLAAPDRFQEVGRLVRVEAAELVVGYTFDLRTNDPRAERIPNPRAGTEHRFVAYRLKTQATKPVSMVARPGAIVEDIEDSDE